MALVDPIRELQGGTARMDRKPTVEEMRRALGFDEIRPIYVNSDDVADDLAGTGDAFADWYEEDLREYYELLERTIIPMTTVT